MSSTTAALRRFNRTWTQRVGALDESFLGTGLPLGVSRLLFEIGPRGAGVRELRERLGLDSGYLTRLLQRLTAEGLTDVAPDPADGRRRLVTLTPRGRRAWQDLDDRSERLAHSLVDSLSDRQRARLTDALAAADLLVRAATVRLRRVAPTEPAAIAATRHYFAELDARFPEGFDPGNAAYAGSAGHGVFVVATSDGRPVACGGVQQIDEQTAEIKRMWVADDWRGAGLGTRMLRHLEAEAARLGHARVVLDTHDALTEAVSMYERAGYRRIERYNENPYARAWFAKDLGGTAT